MATHEISIIVTGKDKASGALGKVKGALGGLGKVAGIAGLAGVGAVAGIGAGLISLAKNAEPLEGIGNAFEGISEAAGVSSVEMLGALEEGSMGMIAQRDLMETFNKASMLVSDQFATALPDAMGYLSKVSSSTGEDMTFMMDSLVTGVGRLSPMILDNLGIQVDLTSANEAYAAQIGKTAGELTKEEQQTALMNQVMEKLAENTGAMPDVLDNAGTKSAQMQAKMTNLKDTIGVKLLPIWTKLQDKLLELADKYLPKLIDFFEKTVIPILEESVVPAIELVVEWLGENIPKAFEQIKKFWENPLKGILNKIVGFIKDPLIPIIEDVVEWLGENIPKAFETIKAFWEDPLKGIFEAIVAFIEDPLIPIIEDVVEWLGENIPKAFEQVKKFWEDPLKKIFQAIVDFVGDPLIVTVMKIVAFFTETLPEAWGKVKGYWEDLKKIFQSLIDFINDDVLGVFTSLKEGLTGAFTGAVGVIKGALNSVIGLIEGGVNAAINGLNKLVDGANKIPGVNLPHIPQIKLPRLAAGGMTLAPEMLAMLHGNEAVLPLDSPRTISALAAALREAIGGGGTNMNYPMFQISADSPGDLFEQLQSIS